MFGSIGIGEMLLIAGVALVVIGPEKFPDFAKIVLRTVRDIRGYMDELKTEATKELRPVQREMQELSRVDPEKYIDSLTRDDEKETPGAGQEGFTDRYTDSLKSRPNAGQEMDAGADAAAEEPEEEPYREAVPGEDHAQGYEQPAQETESGSASAQEEPAEDSEAVLAQNEAVEVDDMAPEDPLDRLEPDGPERLDG